MSVKCLVYTRFSTSASIYTVQGDKAASADSQKIASRIKSMKIREEQREIIRTDYGQWFVTRDHNDISYAVCTSHDYPERHAYGLIAKLQQLITKIPNCEYETEEVIKAATKKQAQELVRIYSDLSKIDKLAQAQSTVSQLELELKQGLEKIVGNKESLIVMGEKSQALKGQAELFKNKASDLQRMLYWRNCKIKIIVGLCIVGLIGFVVLIIVQKTNSN